MGKIIFPYDLGDIRFMENQNVVLAETVAVPEIKKNAYFFDSKLKFLMERDFQKNTPIMLTGPAGTGKTTALTDFYDSKGLKYVRVNLNGQTTLSDLIGTWCVRGGETVWLDGCVTTAMREGYPCIIDENDYGTPEMLGALNPILEGKALILKEKGGEEVTPHKNFRISCTANTVGSQEIYKYLYNGTITLNTAYLDRCSIYTVNYPSVEKELQIILSRFPALEGNEEIPKFLEVISIARSQFLSGSFSFPVSPRMTILVAECLNDGMSFVDAFESTFQGRMIDETYRVFMSYVDRVFNFKK